MPSPTQCAIFVVRLLYNRTFLVTQPVFVLWWKKIRNRKSRWCCLYNWSILRFIYICLLLGATVCVHSASCLRPQEERKLWACKKEHECKWNICIFLFHIFIGASATIFSFIEFSFWVFFQKKKTKIAQTCDDIPGVTVFDGHLRTWIIWHCSLLMKMVTFWRHFLSFLRNQQLLLTC